jgi:nicotinamidase-related amidase
MADTTLALDAKTTALVLIDLQYAIVGRDTKPYAAADVVERSRKMAEALRAKGGTVVYIHVKLGEFLNVPSDEAMQLPKELPANASDIVPEAGMQDGDLLIAKRHWGAFAGTSLEAELRARGVETIVLAGIATNIGVESTLRQGTGLSFAFVTVEDACATFSDEMQAFAFSAIFPRLSKVRSTDEVIAALA